MRRILFVTPVSPFDRRSGSEQRSWLMLEALSFMGTVDVLWLTPDGVNEWVEHQSSYRRYLRGKLSGADGFWRRFRPKEAATTSVERFFASPIGDYDLIVGRYVWGVCQLRVPPEVPVLVDLDDYRFRFSRLYAVCFSHFPLIARKTLGHLLARRALARFSAAWVVSPRDFEEVSAECVLPVRLLSNVAPPVVRSRLAIRRRQQVLFVGSLWYQPNEHAVDWFLKKVWGLVRARVPNAELLLVGSASESRRASWSSVEGVSAPGFVEDLDAAYAASKVAVVPLQAGGGTNIKALEALSAGIPCVVSSFVGAAFSPTLQKGLHFREAADAEAFAREVIEVLLGIDEEGDMQRCHLAAQAVETHYSERRFIDTVQETARMLLKLPSSGASG